MTDQIKNGGPAFPEPGLSGLPNGEFIHGQSGMTLRDYFAAKAMQVLIQTEEVAHDESLDAYMESTAEAAYQYADAMLVVREKQS